MTLAKSSNWWETPGLGELSMAAGSIPLGLGTYVAGTKLLSINPRAAAAAGVLAGTAQAADKIIQARTNGRAGLVTPSSPLADAGKSILTGGMGVLGGLGLSSVANLGTPSKKGLAAVGALLSAADFARRRGRAAIERRAYENELERQMGNYYSKEAQVNWYGHEKLSGSLLGRHVDVKPSSVVLPSSTSTLEFLLQKFAAETAAVSKLAPSPPNRRQNRENRRLLGAAERSARNAASSGNFSSSNPTNNSNRFRTAVPQNTTRAPAPTRDPAVLAASAARRAQAQAPRAPAPTRDPAVLAASAARRAQAQAPPSNLQNRLIAAAPPSPQPVSRPAAAAPQTRPAASAPQTRPAAAPPQPRQAAAPVQQSSPFSSVARMQNNARNAVNAVGSIRGFV